MIERFLLKGNELLGERMIRVYLPPNYNSNCKYPVLYMHDGHNLFDVEDSYCGNIWDAHISMDHISSEYHKDLIIVGIDCHKTNRLNEYCPFKFKCSKSDIPHDLIHLYPNVGGTGDIYLEFIVKTLKPLIDSKYRTIKDETYMAGSSMGGYISLYAIFKYPKVFKKVGCLSSAIWFNKEDLINYIKNNYKDPVSIYFDVGDQEGEKNNQLRYVNDTLDIVKLLKELGNDDLKLVIDKGGNHSEIAWKKRFPIFIKWLLEIND